MHVKQSSTQPKCVEITARKRSYSSLLRRRSICKGCSQGLNGHFSRYSWLWKTLHVATRRISIDTSPWKHLKNTTKGISATGIKSKTKRRKENRNHRIYATEDLLVHQWHWLLKLLHRTCSSASAWAMTLLTLLNHGNKEALHWSTTWSHSRNQLLGVAISSLHLFFLNF